MQVEAFRKAQSPGGGMVDALVSGTSVFADVQVRVLFWAHAPADKRSMTLQESIICEMAP